MKNVYDRVSLFYEEEISWEPAIKREWAEGFLRFKAWQGTTDEQLRVLWKNIYMLEIYLSYSGIELLDEIQDYEYSLLIEWLAENMKGYKKSIKGVKQFFVGLIEFYEYLESKKMIQDTTALKSAAEMIAGGKKIEKITPPKIEELLNFTDDIDIKHIENYSNVMQSLLEKIVSFYNDDRYVNDTNRNMRLYAEIRNLQESEDENFWMGFWDFFIFDYHLIGNDKNPLQHFLELFPGKLSDQEQNMITLMINAKFTTFYINSMIEGDWVECIDLFTQEPFYIPRPEGDFRQLTKLLFTGHIIYNDDLSMFNNLVSVEISPILRRRIREEMERQKELFIVKEPETTWQDFLKRHAANVKYTIDLLTNYQRLNVTPLQQLHRSYPSVDTSQPVNQEVVLLLETVMKGLAFSQYDIQLATKMWNDFNQIHPVAVRKPLTWALAIIYLFSDMNCKQGVSAASLAEHFEVSVSTIYKQRSVIAENLQLQKFDARYLSEEGFLYALLT